RPRSCFSTKLPRARMTFVQMMPCRRCGMGWASTTPSTRSTYGSPPTVAMNSSAVIRFTGSVAAGCDGSVTVDIGPSSAAIVTAFGPLAKCEGPGTYVPGLSAPVGVPPSGGLHCGRPPEGGTPTKSVRLHATGHAGHRTGVLLALVDPHPVEGPPDE